MKTFLEKSHYWKGPTQKANYLGEPFPALTCSSMPENLICISILAKLVCGSNAQRSLTWWASPGRKRQLPLRRAARLLNDARGRRPRWRSKPPVTAAGGSFHFAHISSPPSSARILKGISLSGFSSNTNRTFLQSKLRWNGSRRFLELTSRNSQELSLVSTILSKKSYRQLLAGYLDRQNKKL